MKGVRMLIIRMLIRARSCPDLKIVQRDIETVTRHITTYLFVLSMQ
jgi:hypothetical protein